jgi:hypothetical protein
MLQIIAGVFSIVSPQLVEITRMGPISFDRRRREAQEWGGECFAPKTERRMKYEVSYALELR